MNSVAYNNFRKNKEHKHSTRIKWGLTDLVLLKKPQGGSWNYVNSTDLPPVDLDAKYLPKASSSASPPAGRSRTNKRHRQSSSGESNKSPENKTSRTTSPPHLNLPDPGIFSPAEGKQPPSAPLPFQTDGNTIDERGNSFNVDLLKKRHNSFNMCSPKQTNQSISRTQRTIPSLLAKKTLAKN